MNQIRQQKIYRQMSRDAAVNSIRVAEKRKKDNPVRGNYEELEAARELRQQVNRGAIEDRKKRLKKRSGKAFIAGILIIILMCAVLLFITYR